MSCGFRVLVLGANRIRGLVSWRVRVLFVWVSRVLVLGAKRIWGLVSWGFIEFWGQTGLGA